MKEGSTWVARVPAADSAPLAELRLAAGLEIAETGGVVWVRGPAWNEALERALRKVSGLEAFELLASGRLLARGARVPHGRLPELHWQPIALWFPVTLPAIHGLTAAPRPTVLRLIRTSEVRPAGGVLTGVAEWLAFANAAAEVRLRPLRFAAARDGRIWIEGTPIPTLPGRRFSLAGGVAIPCGFTCAPALSSPALRRWLGLAAGDAALASEAGAWEIIKAEQFVPAMRSAVRATAEILGHE